METKEQSNEKRSPGRPKSDDPKERVTIRLDSDVLKALKEPEEKGWQTRANKLLRKGLKLDG